jgi:hypothetical protein
VKYRVEVWEVQSYFIEVEAEDADKARTEAAVILQEMTPENYGCTYGDRWTDVMDAEEVKPDEAGPIH